ncbi:hypothetical protein PBR20603_01475 [Pandoraea bronchicola]|uniref:Uncharacterized protein n=2 Tax=Pandoraea bronchicola TaxID=2508287 RepID=A0A5E5BNW5_9BURK|nr:hypothetical protein PBR20603_01475 [Pandoraea bronchicola]
MYFAFGLASAVIDMYANAMGHLRRANEITKRIDKWDKLKSPPSNPLDLLSPLRRGKLAFIFAELFGWLSAGGFLLGVIPFIRLGMS